MITYIYDIEVFSDDWIVVFRRPEDGSNHIVIHNDNARLREFLAQPDIILGGFNNKHYDDYVILTMILGGSNVEVKRHNDYIISGNQPWTFPFVQYKKKPFKSFDLRDDIPDPGISLKAIEGNLKLPIVESSVPFDIDRKLTPEELEEVIRYCKYDVDSTVRLYWERKKNYLDAKILAGGIYGIDPFDALGYTNARLSAEALEATYTERDDERDYVIPEKLPVDRIPKIVLDFFLQIQDKSIPDAKLFGAGKGSKGMTLEFILKTGGGECPVTFAWGGVHGAVPCIIIEIDDEYILINQDVGSLYPNSKINFGYCSRSMKDQDAYKKLVDLRLHYKALAKAVNKEIVKILGGSWYHDFSDEDADGNTFFNLDKAKAGTDEETYKKILEYLDYDAKQSSLKLIINTCYGAMLAKGNGLCDRLHGRSVCITNQICMAILISDLAKACKTIWFVNINTDGIMYRIHKSEADLAQKIIDDWCNLTGFTMEEDNFSKVIQKDVNNYIGIYKDGHFKTKGGYVSLYEGGNFKTNSLQIIHKAIVDNLVKGIDPEVTIRECTDVTAFQQIIKTGGSYEGSYHYINDVREPIQKVNRVYAVKDPKYGAVVKGKWITEKRKKNKDTGKMESTPVDPPVWSETVISECPEHCFIDNENVLTVDDLDLDYYIDMAKKRIDKYINIDPTVARKIAKIKEEVIIMAENKEVTPIVTEELGKLRDMNIYAKLLLARKWFRETGVKKNGINDYANYDYYTPEDIKPVKQVIFEKLGLNDIFNMTRERAWITLVNIDNVNESIVFECPVSRDESMIKNPVQKDGAEQTYYNRYLHISMLDIVEADAIEAVTDKPEAGKSANKKSTKPATPEEQKEIKDQLVNQGGKMNKTQINGIKNGLKKLMEKHDITVPDEEEDFDLTFRAWFNALKGTEARKNLSALAKKLVTNYDKSDAENLLIAIGKEIEK